MKLILTLILLLHFMQIFAQTKKETIDWINSKFPQNAIIYDEYFPGANFMKINQDGTFEIKALLYKKSAILYKAEIETTTIITGNLKNLTANSVSILKQNKLFFININCSNNNECINTFQTGRSGISYSKNGVTFGAFQLNEENISERLKKAFKHLISLCGGKKEVF